MPSDSSGFWIAAGGFGTLISAGFLCWYTVLTYRLVRITKWASEPFVTLTMSDLTLSKSWGAIHLRNLGGSPALDVTVTVDTRNVPLADGMKRLYRCDVLSPGGQTLMERQVPLEGGIRGQRFLIEYRNVAGHRRSAPAALVLDPIQDSCFIWDFPRSTWWDRWIAARQIAKLP